MQKIVLDTKVLSDRTMRHCRKSNAVTIAFQTSTSVSTSADATSQNRQIGHRSYTLNRSFSSYNCHVVDCRQSFFCSILCCWFWTMFRYGSLPLPRRRNYALDCALAHSHVYSVPSPVPSSFRQTALCDSLLLTYLEGIISNWCLNIVDMTWER